MAHNSGYTKLFVDRTDPNNPVGISLGEIRRCLYGVSGGAGVDLSRSPNINKWAKFKPMPVGDVSGYTDTQAKLINYGLFVPYYTSLHSMFEDILDGTWTRAANYDQNKTFWAYDGLGVNDISRTLDFDGYLHNARELYSQVTAQAYCDIDSDPVFITHTENSTDGNLGPKDIRVISSGSIVAENLYYGIFLYNGITARQFKIIGQAANITTGDKSYSDSRFVFPRMGVEETIKACMFLSSTNIGNGAVVIDNDAFNGYFIPIPSSLATVFVTFEGMSAGLSGNPDTVMPWWNSTGDNVIFVFKSTPNRGHTWKGNLFGEYTSGGVQTVLQTDFFEVTLPDRDPYPCWIRVETDFANDRATVKVYVTDTTVSFGDVATENNVGSPISTTVVDIVDGNYNVGQMTRAMIVLDSIDGSAPSQSCGVGTWPSQ